MNKKKFHGYDDMQPFRCNYNSMFYIYGAEQRTGYAHSCLRDCISGISAAGGDGFSAD